MLLKTFRYKKIYSPLKLNRLQFFVDSGRINPKEPITMFDLRRSGAIAGRIKDGLTLLGGVSCSSFFITMSFTKPLIEGHKVILRKGFANFLFQAQILTSMSHILLYYINSRRHVDLEKIQVPDEIWTHDPPWFFRVYVSPRIYIISCCCYFSVHILFMINLLTNSHTPWTYFWAHPA